jgi:hypothetical protein
MNEVINAAAIKIEVNNLKFLFRPKSLLMSLYLAERITQVSWLGTVT